MVALFLPPVTAHFTLTPWTNAFNLTGGFDYYWHMQGTPVAIKRVQYDDYLYMFNKSVATVRKVTDNNANRTRGSVWAIDNVLAWQNGNATKGVGWDYLFVNMLPYMLDGQFVYQQNIYMPSSKICWPEGGIGCATTLGDPLNFLDDIRGITYCSSSSSCSEGNNYGGSVWTPLSQFSFWTANRNDVGPLKTPDTALAYDQSRSAYLGDNLIVVVDSYPNEDVWGNNRVRLFRVIPQTRTAGDCQFNKINVILSPVYELDMRNTPYANTFTGSNIRPVPVAPGAFLLHNKQGTMNSWLLFRFPGPIVQVMQFNNSALSPSNYCTWVDPSGAIIIWNPKIVPNDVNFSDSIFKINFNIRLPSYADPHFVNGTDTIEIL